MDEQIEKRGLHNWRNLFRKPTFLEWIIFFMVIMSLFMAWAYQHDIRALQDFYNRSACNICDEQRGLNIKPILGGGLSLSNYSFTIKEETSGTPGEN